MNDFTVGLSGSSGSPGFPVIAPSGGVPVGTSTHFVSFQAVNVPKRRRQRNRNLFLINLIIKISFI